MTTESKWTQQELEGKPAYTRGNFTLVAVPMNMVPPHWEIRHNGKVVTRVADLMEAMDYSAHLEERVE
ncbi:MAG: hypothetical protein OXE17_00590 [Chloroflexi bacterium]|nr:hypothetical protein [Chloroflexota bacterium]